MLRLISSLQCVKPQFDPASTFPSASLEAATEKRTEDEGSEAVSRGFLGRDLLSISLSGCPRAQHILNIMRANQKAENDSITCDVNRSSSFYWLRSSLRYSKSLTKLYDKYCRADGLLLGIKTWSQGSIG